MKKQPVLVSFSFVVDAPATDAASDDAQHERLSRFLKAFSNRMTAKFLSGDRRHPRRCVNVGTTYYYLNEEPNAGKCAVCRQWTTDISEPDAIQALEWGKNIKGKLVCVQCYDALHEIDESASEA